MARVADNDPLSVQRVQFLATVFSPAELARWIGVSPSLTSRWASREERPGPAAAPALIDLEHVYTRARQSVKEALKAKQQRIKSLGKENAALVVSALAAVKQVRASQAARAGWLGDVDFSADIREITDKFQKAHALQKVASELSALDKPSLDDRKILSEANTTGRPGTRRRRTSRTDQEVRNGGAHM